MLLDGAADGIDAAWLAEAAACEPHHKARRRSLRLVAAVLAVDRCGDRQSLRMLCAPASMLLQIAALKCRVVLRTFERCADTTVAMPMLFADLRLAAGIDIVASSCCCYTHVVAARTEAHACTCVGMQRLHGGLCIRSSRRPGTCVWRQRACAAWGLRSVQVCTQCLSASSLPSLRGSGVHTIARRPARHHETSKIIRNVYGSHSLYHGPFWVTSTSLTTLSSCEQGMKIMLRGSRTGPSLDRLEGLTALLEAVRRYSAAVEPQDMRIAAAEALSASGALVHGHPHMPLALHIACGRDGRVACAC